MRKSTAETGSFVLRQLPIRRHLTRFFYSVMDIQPEHQKVLLFCYQYTPFFPIGNKKVPIFLRVPVNITHSKAPLCKGS